MEIEDVRSDLNALRKLYGLLQSNKGNFIQIAGSENLDYKSRQLLKKLLDGATEQTFQSQSKMIEEKSAASFLPDSYLLENSQEQPTSHLPDTSGKTKPSKKKEFPQSSQAPNCDPTSLPEERDESQSQQRVFAAERQKKLKIDHTESRSDVKRQISGKEKKTQTTKENHAQRPRQRHHRQTRLRVTWHEKELDSREEAEICQNSPSIVRLPLDSTSSPRAYNGSGHRSLELSQKLVDKHEKKADITISEEAAMAILRIEEHLPSNLRRGNDLPSQQLMMSQKRNRAEMMDPPSDHFSQKSRWQRNMNPMIRSAQDNESEHHHHQLSSKMVVLNIVKDRVGPKHKDQQVLPKEGTYELDQISQRLLIGNDHPSLMTTSGTRPTQMVKEYANQPIRQETVETLHKKDQRGGSDDQVSQIKRTGPNGPSQKLSHTHVPARLVGPALETKDASHCQSKENEPSDPDQKRNEQTINRPMDEKSKMKRNITESTVENVPAIPMRRRATEKPNMKERVVHPDRMTSRINDRGPCHPARLLTRTVENDMPCQMMSRLSLLDQKKSVESKQLQNRAPDKHSSTVGPILEKLSFHIPSTSSGPTRGLHHKIEQKDPKHMKRHLAWKGVPSRTSSKLTQTTSRTNSSSVSQTSFSSSIPSQRPSSGDLQLLTHRGVGPKKGLPRRTLTHCAGLMTRRTLTLPPPSHEKSLTKPKMYRKLADEQESIRGAMSHHRSLLRPPRHLGVEHPTPTSDADDPHQGHQEKPVGRLRRFKNKLAIIFHHHHHHHHHHHLSHKGESGQDDDDEELASPVHHHHRSFWRYLREVIHHTSQEDHVKVATEVRVAKTIGKSVVRRAPPKQQHGHLHALVERMLRHVWHSRKKQGQVEHRKRLVKSGSGVRAKQKKVHWWQGFHKRRGVKLTNRKNNRLTLGFRRPKNKTT